MCVRGECVLVCMSCSHATTDHRDRLQGRVKGQVDKWMERWSSGMKTRTVPSLFFIVLLLLQVLSGVKILVPK